MERPPNHPPATALRIDGVVLIARDFVSQRAFYERVLGLALSGDYGDAAFYDLGSQRLGIFARTHHREGTRRLRDAQHGLSHIEFGIDPAHRVEMEAYLRRRGAYAYGGDNFVDADDNLFHFLTRPPGRGAASSIGLVELASISLFARRYADQVSFYQSALGLSRAADAGRCCRFRMGNQWLDVLDAENEASQVGTFVNRSPLAAIGLSLSTASMSNLLERASGMGVSVSAEQTIVDRDGNVICLTSHGHEKTEPRAERIDG